MIQKNTPVKIFLSYASSDKGFRDTLLIHLSLMIRNNQVDIWDDEKIHAGANWKKEIETKLKETDIAILLVSADYLASDFINDFEMPILIEQHKTKETTIIPIWVRSVYLYGSELSNFQGLPKKGKAISYWQNKDEAWMEVVSELAKVIERKQKGKLKEKGTNNLNVENISDLIAKGRIKEATIKLKELVAAKNDISLINTLTVLTNRFEILNKKSMIGIISKHEELLERNKITYSILNILEEL